MSLLLPLQPSRVFSIRGLRLYFPELEPWVAWGAAVRLVYLCANVGPWGATHRSACPALRHSESALPVYVCANVGPQGLLVLGLPGPFVPHSASLGPATVTRVFSTPVPVSAPPTSLDECLFFISLVSDPLVVRFSVSSGCARRRSVSTYAAILVVSLLLSVSMSYTTPGTSYERNHTIFVLLCLDYLTWYNVLKFTHAAACYGATVF